MQHDEAEMQTPPSEVLVFIMIIFRWALLGSGIIHANDTYCFHYEGKVTGSLIFGKSA